MSFAGKLGTTLFALVFGIGFSMAGYFGGIAPLARQTSEWWQARSYVAVPARITGVELEQRDGSEGGTIYHVAASFSYTVGGREYVGKRASLGGGFDNVSDYHHRLYAELEQARSGSGQVHLWVDPVHPERSLYDRSMRWQMNVFLLPFATLFPAVGLAALWVAFAVWFRKDAPGPPALVPGQEGALRAEGSGAGFLFLFSAVWNLLSWPIAIMEVNAILNGASNASLFVVLFPIIGLVMLGVALRTWRQRRRLGEPGLEVRALAPLRGRIHFVPPLGERANPGIDLLEVCVEVALVKDAGPREDDKPVTLWHHSMPAARRARGTAAVDFELAVPRREADDVGVEVTVRAVGGKAVFRLPRTAATL